MIKPGGFSEVGISTTCPETWIDLLSNIGGYKVIWKGHSPDENKRLWQIPERSCVQECLLGNPDSNTGFIRLFHFENIPQKEIRRNSVIWDSGGLFDVDIRVQEVLPLVARLEANGFAGISQPADWQFGPFTVREWLATGPDAVTLALMQRLAPPLEGWDSSAVFSRMFNSSQVVRDMASAKEFYRGLGFIEVMRHHAPMPPKAGEMLGLAPDIAHTTKVELVILQPQGEMEGSVELVGIESLPGRNFSGRAWPTNLGLNMLRFPVDDLKGYTRQIKAAGITPLSPGTIQCTLEPYGATLMTAVQSPDGVWLEFYQT